MVLAIKERTYMKVQKVGLSAINYKSNDTLPVNKQVSVPNNKDEQKQRKHMAEKTMLYLGAGAAITIAGLYLAKKGFIDKYSTTDIIKESVDKAAKKGEEGAEKTKQGAETLKDGADTIKENVQTTIETTKDTIENVAETVKNTVNTAIESTKEVIENTVESAKEVTQTVKETVKNGRKITDYIIGLAAGVEELTGKKVKPESLSSVMDKKEFLSTIKELKPENYVASKENIEKGIFQADLHSHSQCSDGKATVEDILDEVASYADKLHEKTGKPFIFALTDHDSINGCKKALTIISKNPEKFENVRFIPATEASYLIKSDKGNPLETTELLIYGINPFSKNVSGTFSALTTNRKLSRNKYIKELSKTFPDTEFSKPEFNDVFLGESHSHHPIMNSYWETYHYGQIKKVLSDTAKAKGENPEEYFAQTMAKAPDKLNLYEFKQKGLVEGWINENPEIAKINDKFKPYIDENGEIVKRTENTLDNLASMLEEEKESTVGFAHPYYLTQRTSDIQGVVKEAKEKLGADKFVFAETYHQAYSPDITQHHAEELQKINDIMNAEAPLKLGGRDNHETKWLNV